MSIHPSASDLADLSLRRLLESLATGEGARGGGSAAALAGAMAASLVAMAARRSSSSWPEAGGIAAQARVLEQRCLTLAGTDAEAFGEGMAALDRGFEIEAPLQHSVDVLLDLGEAAGDVAVLAAATAERCEGSVRPDAVAAALLAESAVKVARVLITCNLVVVRTDERLGQIGRTEETATQSARRAVDGTS